MAYKVRQILAAVSLSLFLVAGASAQIKVNQTDGFGKDQLLTFTYGQSFSCIHRPFDDLDNNGKIAAVDPAEFQRPRCVVGREHHRSHWRAGEGSSQAVRDCAVL